MPNKNYRVAIFQNTITGGGRIKVVNEIIGLLNQMEVIPDIFTFRVNPSFKSEANLNCQIKKIPQYIRGFYEIKIVLLNLLMQSKSKEYDLLINSNNSLLFAPSDKPTLAYIYFPREMRVLTDLVSLAFPDGTRVNEASFASLQYRKFLRWLYGFRKYSTNTRILADSQYTKQMFLQAYPKCPAEQIDVIYPPVELKKWRQDQPKENRSVVTLGRFCDEKRQLEQIQIAEAAPDLHFKIIGFVGDRESKSYYILCQKHISQRHIKNVTLLPNLPVAETITTLQQSQFFMHNLRNEPFGLSTVEAIAAGCIPLVPNSGGQVEIVPIPELRFETKEEAIRKISEIQKLDMHKIRKLLISNSSLYDVSNFRAQFAKELNTILPA